jgi:uncharacterized protein YbjT (DUF2867 family)
LDIDRHCNRFGSASSGPSFFTFATLRSTGHGGDLEKTWTLAPAFAGADTIWILTPPGPRAVEQSSNALWAARQGGAKHVVRMSAIGAAHTAPTINSRLHALSDAELAASGIPFTILKPHFLAQNFMMVAKSVAERGEIYFALADGKMGIIDSRDQMGMDDWTVNFMGD